MRGGSLVGKVSVRVDTVGIPESGGVSIGVSLDMDTADPRSEVNAVFVTVVGCCHKNPSSYVHLLGVLLFKQRLQVGYSRSHRNLRVRHCVHAIVRRRRLRTRSGCILP
jgi:hypothetical protein